MENQEMMEKLQKSLKINHYINLFVAALLICVLVGGGLVVQKITPAIAMVQDVRTSLHALEQIDYQALNTMLKELDVQALNEKIDQLDVVAINEALSSLDIDTLNAQIDALDIESLNDALEGLDTEEMTEAMENLNNAVDKLEDIEASLKSIGDWFNKKFNF